MKKKLPKAKDKKEKKNFFKSKFNILKVNGEFEFMTLLKNILLTIGGSALIGFFTRNSTEMYNVMKKPWFSPPSIVFPIVWPILYLLMAIAAYRITLKLKGKSNNNEIFYYLLQLSLNFLWSIIFFNLRLYGISFILILVLLVFIIITAVKFFKVDKIAGYLMIPYILWVSYASLLTFFIWKLNEM